MKKIEAIIRKSKFDEVVKALHDAEVYFFSYWDVTGVGNEKIGKVYRGITYSTKDIQRRYLSIVVSDSFVDTTVDAIINSGATGNVGDGKIFILPCCINFRYLYYFKKNPTISSLWNFPFY